MTNRAKWWSARVDEGRGGVYAVYAGDQRRARRAVARYSSLLGYRVSANQVELQAGPSDYSEVVSCPGYRAPDGSTKIVGETRRYIEVDNG